MLSYMAKYRHRHWEHASVELPRSNEELARTMYKRARARSFCRYFESQVCHCSATRHTFDSIKAEALTAYISTRRIGDYIVMYRAWLGNL